MSSLMSQARTRLPRFAEAAVERARLTVVPIRRSQARRMPFAVLVFGLLAAGVVGLLMFNTQMQQASFYATSLQHDADSLVARQQSLDMTLDRLRDPQRLAEQGKRLGMVAPAVPAFIRLSDGAIVGTPTATSAEDAVRIRPNARPRPAKLSPPPIIVRVHAPAKKAATAGSGNAVTTSAAGSNGGQDQQIQGATR